MPEHFSQKLERKHQEQLHRKTRERRKMILRDFTFQLRTAISITKGRHERGDTDHVEVIKIPYWANTSSVMWVADYSKLDDPNAAISGDVDYFIKVVDSFRAKYPEWNFTVTLSSADSKVPVELSLQKM